MLKQRISRLAAAVVLAIVSVAGCSSSSPPAVPTTDTPVTEVEQPSVQTHVTFYVAGMNQRLKILWGDWPNTVKQALVELNAVESVEDEWERELESDEDLDLLFVTFDAKQITVHQLLEKIKAFGFEARVKE